ncbi:hypothetical protein Tco_0797009 [Tanacetum coccineum]
MPREYFGEIFDDPLLSAVASSSTFLQCSLMSFLKWPGAHTQANNGNVVCSPWLSVVVGSGFVVIVVAVVVVIVIAVVVVVIVVICSCRPAPTVLVQVAKLLAVSACWYTGPVMFKLEKLYNKNSSWFWLSHEERLQTSLVVLPVS